MATGLLTPTQMTQQPAFEMLKTLVSQDNVLELARNATLVAEHARTVDINGRGLLHAAAHARAGDTLQWLLDTGAMSVDMADSQGETPLMRAAWLGYKPGVDMLLEAGAKLTQTSLAGGTPLHFAYAGGSAAAEVVETLLSAGASADATDKSGANPASWAAQAAAREAGERLIAQEGAGRSKLSMTRKTG